MNTLQHVSIYFPNKLVFGSGVINQIAEELSGYNAQKVLLVTIEPILKALEPLLADIKARQIEVQIDTSIVQEPTFEDFFH
jgi:alcohol dehydrogenase class IV